MTHTLFRGPRAKIARTREQLQQLKLEFQRFSDSKPYTITQECDLEAEQIRIIYNPGGPIPDRWAVLIGEIFFNLRSALDQAIHELIVLEQGKPLRTSEFPVCVSRERFEAVESSKIHGLSQKTRDLIEGLQPYHITEPDKIHILRVLHDMNIRDKHQEMFLCRGLSDNFELNLLEPIQAKNITFDSWRFSLDEKTVRIWIHLPEGSPHREVEVDASAKMSRAYLSPAYTTDVTQVLRVTA